ncbi:hypothetical protein THASP1DRAFT_33696 [Thamnocephalis sphaerospora]|uniref:Uncharacterized protein n=1 Tax=Thamnocephalis sphaerospora TaxID=78915 RepID=A0A4P9XH73_9FUNG|nr:hypothetical protein THASP1DRAFT_33696 [Thamnocephalis sphaerospora]|eukprot:RKP04530.1 hypothetical protein THASP1DRAFT_33696 [Thamnocephalis sphaerospora]
MHLIRHRKVTDILCFWQALLYLVGNAYVLYRIAEPSIEDCFQTSTIYQITFILSMLSIHIVLLIKAYICSSHAWYLLAASAVCEAPFLCYSINTAMHPNLSVVSWDGCTPSPDIHDTLLRAVINLLPSALLSLSFLYSVRKQFHGQSSVEMRSTLLTDGVLYLLGVTLSNVFVCTTVITGLLLGYTWTAMFSFDWIVASTLIVHQLRRPITDIRSS